MRKRVALLVATLALSAPATATAALPAIPKIWPKKTLAVGGMSFAGEAASFRAKSGTDIRYQGLAGGVNTGNGWATQPSPEYVTSYIKDSRKSHLVSFFMYYQIQKSLPGAGQPNADQVRINLGNAATMKAYFADVRLFFQRARAGGGPVVLQVEPDMWGYIENASEDPTRFPVQVAASGDPDVQGLPNNAAGLAQAFIRLRDRYAPNVAVAYALSIWGTKSEIFRQDPPNKTIDAVARKSAAFYKKLGAKFDLTVGELNDGDAAFNELVRHDMGASWFKAADFARVARYFKRYSTTTKQRIVLYQIPVGNTVMRTENNTFGHYQDNKVEWFLGKDGTKHLQAYAKAGIMALLFGGSTTSGTTCIFDCRKDGITNPAPINGNTLMSLSADDDGGYWAAQTKAYYKRGPLRLPR
jgi:hypothetical protein